MIKGFSGPVRIFHGLRLPETGIPTGYAALIDAYDLMVPFPYTLCAIGSRHRILEQDGWRLFTPRHAPSGDLEGHLVFALKNEGVDLAVLNRLFEKINPAEIEKIVQNTPTGAYARRIWFFYEWLRDKQLDLPDLDASTYVPALDPELQWSIPGEHIRRQRVINNLPGTREFCPLVYRSPGIEKYIHMDLKKKALDVLGRIPQDVVSRTAAFLLLKDSRASYTIEGEVPAHSRIERWGRIIGEAGRNPLTMEELERLQEIVIGDSRFVSLGYRDRGGFVGEHDRDTGVPIPEHISARPEDVPALVRGIIEFNRRTEGALNPIIAAASVAFGFVYVHPFFDGNGRLHRYLLHHVLARGGYNPPGLIFPVSAAILDRIEEYGTVLRGYSHKLLALIDWEPTDDNNLTVVNRTEDYYRFFDATPHAEFLFACVLQTIEKDLPEETAFLQNYDRFKAGVESIADMPGNTIHLLFRFLRQNGGTLSQRARSREFAQLRPEEAERIEELYGELFER